MFSTFKLFFSRAVAATDAYFKYVTLLLNTTSTNGAQNNTFLDGSTNAFSITRNGNTTQGNFSPFSQTGWSNYFDGTGDFLSVANNTALNLTSGDFTIECWFYSNTALSTLPILIQKDWNPGVTYPQYGITFDATGKLQAGVGNSTSTEQYLTGTTVVSANTWHHVAFVLSGSTLYLFLNGVQEATATRTVTITSSTNALVVGCGGTAGTNRPFNGYISNARIVKGTAVYTGAFTPPTAPLTNITNTSLLTCQSNRFIDNSSNAFAITRNGDVSVQAFSPFNPTAAWSASTNGGSGYFDGTGDYLTAPDNAAFDFGSGDFTVEAFVYLSSLPASNARYNIFGQWGPNPGANDLAYIGQLFNDAGTMKITFDWSTTGTTTNGVAITASVVANTWLHIAWVRSGTSLKIFLNGTEVTSGSTITGTLWNSSRPLNIGRNEAGNSNLLNGYLSNLRIVKGTAVYTANFTPPTAPLTAITNTSLLLNFTNAGIYDSASGNDLETVGNAQVSTTQAKWGTTSMAFDGTGDWLVVPSRPALRLGSADFTIEYWVYPTNLTGTIQHLNTEGPSAVTNYSFAIITSGTNLLYYLSSTGTTWNIASGVSIGTATLNTWQHVALVRSGNTFTPYLNGVAGTTSTSSAALFGFTSALAVGNAVVSSPVGLIGYIDDLRITNGYARYTANFTPPTAAFPLN